MRTMLFLWAGFFLAQIEIKASPVFSEHDRTIVVWDDTMIPANKEYENVVVVQGDVEFLGKTANLIILSGGIRLMDGSEVFNQMIVVNGRVEQMPGATVANSGLIIDTPWKRNFNLPQDVKDFWDRTKTNLESFSIFKWIALPLMIALPIALAVIVFVIALIFFAIAPQIAKGSEETFRSSPLRSLAMGIFAYFAFIPAIILMLISIVGIPAIPFFVLFGLLVCFAGLICAFIGTGRFVLQRLNIHSYFLDGLLGLSILLSLHFVPWVGPTVGIAAWIAGTGALLLSLLGRRRGAPSGQSFSASYQIR